MKTTLLTNIFILLCIHGFAGISPQSENYKDHRHRDPVHFEDQTAIEMDSSALDFCSLSNLEKPDLPVFGSDTTKRKRKSKTRPKKEKKKKESDYNGFVDYAGGIGGAMVLSSLFWTVFFIPAAIFFLLSGIALCIYGTRSKRKKSRFLAWCGFLFIFLLVVFAAWPFE